MKHYLCIHQDCQLSILSLYLLDEISCEYAHFQQVLYAKRYCETMSNEFYVNFLTDDICRITNHFRGTCYPILL